MERCGHFLDMVALSTYIVSNWSGSIDKQMVLTIGNFTYLGRERRNGASTVKDAF